MSAGKDRIQLGHARGHDLGPENGRQAFTSVFPRHAKQVDPVLTFRPDALREVVTLGNGTVSQVHDTATAMHFAGDGVYLWKLSAKGREVEERQLSGHVLVVR